MPPASLMRRWLPAAGSSPPAGWRQYPGTTVWRRCCAPFATPSDYARSLPAWQSPSRRAPASCRSALRLSTPSPAECRTRPTADRRPAFAGRLRQTPRRAVSTAAADPAPDQSQTASAPRRSPQNAGSTRHPSPAESPRGQSHTRQSDSRAPSPAPDEPPRAQLMPPRRGKSAPVSAYGYPLCVSCHSSKRCL